MRSLVIFCCSIYLLCPPLRAEHSIQWDQTEAIDPEESLFLRRIADFWQEAEYGIVKHQIEEFLDTFPASNFLNPLCAAMADLLMREKNYSEALNYYSKISSPIYLEQTALNHMQCLYHLQWYATLADQCDAVLKEQISQELALKTTYYLAIALYHQCLNAHQDSALSLKLAQRAQPHFERLSASELSSEVAQAFAHLCCILKDFEKAASIYLELAEKTPEKKEEMTFQAALIQTEFNRTEALATFHKIAKMNGRKSQEASYNLMVLLFEAKQYKDLIDLKDSLLNNIPPDKKDMSHLFLGHAYLELDQYDQSIEALSQFIHGESSPTLESLEGACVSLIEAGFQGKSLEGLTLGLKKLLEIDPSHAAVAKGSFYRALLTKELGLLKEAIEDFKQQLDNFPSSFFRAQILFELASIDYQERNWPSCYSWATQLIDEYPNSQSACYAWRYLASSSIALGNNSPDGSDRIILDLERLLKQKELFSYSEISDWQFFLAKAYFDKHQLKKAISILEPLHLIEEEFSQKGNTYLLLGLCYKQENKDVSSFCDLAEAAMQFQADLIDLGNLHIALFNAYLTRAKEKTTYLEKAAHHLYSAFENHISIDPDNLIWLTEYYRENFKNKELAQRAIVIYNDLLQRESVSRDKILYKLAKLYCLIKQPKQQIAALEKLLQEYNHLADSKKPYETKAKFLLAQGYAAIGQKTIACALYDQVAQKEPAYQNKLCAQALLQKAKLQAKEILSKHHNLTHPDTLLVLSDLKSLVLQKRLNHEPIHLEAALEYVNLRSQLDQYSIDQKIELISKIKTDFESQQDLLSKDYHIAKIQLPEKEKIYLGYMQLFDAEICSARAMQETDRVEQTIWQKKGQALLEEIVAQKVHPALVKRAVAKLKIDQ